MSDALPEFADKVSKECFIGQPVLISDEEAVLRIALGSDSLRSYINDEASTAEEDTYIINKLDVLGSKFEDY